MTRSFIKSTRSTLALALISCSVLTSCSSGNDSAKSNKSKQTAPSEVAKKATTVEDAETLVVKKQARTEAAPILSTPVIPVTPAPADTASEVTVSATLKTARRAQEDGVPSLANHKRAVTFATTPVVVDDYAANARVKSSLSQRGYTDYSSGKPKASYYFEVTDAKRGFKVNKARLNKNNTSAKLSDKESQTDQQPSEIVEVVSKHGLGLKIKSDMIEINEFADQTNSMTDYVFYALKNIYAFAVVPLDLGGLGMDASEARSFSVLKAKNPKFNVRSFYGACRSSRIRKHPIHYRKRRCLCSSSCRSKGRKGFSLFSKLWTTLAKK